MTPYSRPKLSDIYTISQSKLLENHTLHSGTYLYSSYMAVPPPPPLPNLVKVVRGDKRQMALVKLQINLIPLQMQKACL